MSKKLVASIAFAFQISVANACDVTVSPGDNIHSAVANTSFTVVCLAPGVHYVSQSIQLRPGQTFRGSTSNRSDATIVSSAVRALLAASNTSIYNFSIAPSGTKPEFGLLVHNVGGVTAWGLAISGNYINIGVNVSWDVYLGDNYLTSTGSPYNGLPEPNLWISESSNVSVWYGNLYGRANGPGGDGELACYQSSNVNVTGTHVFDSGASAIYYVNCDYSSIRGAHVYNAGEWGLDIVQGSDSIVLDGNYVAGARWGGMIFDRANSSGTITNNQFISNNYSGYAPYCNGINFSGSVGVTIYGNSANTGALTCYPWGS